MNVRHVFDGRFIALVRNVWSKSCAENGIINFVLSMRLTVEYWLRDKCSIRHVSMLVFMAIAHEWSFPPPLPPPIKLIGRCTTKLPSFVKQLKQFLLGILSRLTVVHDGWSFTFKRSEQFAFRLSQHFCVCVSSHTTRQLSIESWNRYIRVNVSLVLSPEMTEKC